MLINLMTDTGPLDVSGYASLHKRALRRGGKCHSKDRVIYAFAPLRHVG